MTNDEALQEMMIKEPFDDGAKIQFSVPDVPYSAITFGLNDDPEVAMWWADQWRLAYLKRFDKGVATNEEAPVIETVTEDTPSEPVDEHFDGQPMYIVKAISGDIFPVCPVHLYQGNPSRFFLNTYPPEQKFMFKFENVGLREDTWFCGGKTEVPNGKPQWCDRFVGAEEFKAKHVAF